MKGLIDPRKNTFTSCRFDNAVADEIAFEYWIKLRVVGENANGMNEARSWILNSEVHGSLWENLEPSHGENSSVTIFFPTRVPLFRASR